MISVTPLSQKTKQQKREELYNKKRSRKSLNKQLMSLDFGFLGPPESDSSDDDMFTGGGAADQSEHRAGKLTSQSQHSYQRLESPRKKYHQVD